MFLPANSCRRGFTATLLATVVLFCLFIDSTTATKIRDGSDPAIMKIDDTYYSADSDGGSIWVHAASSFEGLSTSDGHKVWSDTAGRGEVWAPEITTDGEQSLFICRMSDPFTPTGSRYIISQPRETWEQGDHPMINEGPEAIVDPNGQLHIVYSANGSWDNKYCLADLRLRKGGDPTNVWDWYKSNGCLFGSHQDRMMSGWDATLYIDGPGHHTFALPNGDINNSPGGMNHIPFVFHGVEKGTPYNWGNRAWFTGSFVWWNETTYHRSNVPGDNDNTGFSFKFFE
ncbi:uncharacterized protein BCR38DRAFT_347515 [Pseudomassariella vexata]|uniref:Uncharacterized protein n=1 Tax=Pseudomassariella vexata TaxID=1141098 RepID=A0A1Y2DQA4_9PEZI|nr:uncharacterized protein BCR38DRAFT_347515 [Pseudomassariella vexata]ORY61473.1 hypothetical protein BCR38DRAFT_347515 [Pseudomassariella vexata]